MKNLFFSIVIVLFIASCSKNHTVSKPAVYEAFGDSISAFGVLSVEEMSKQYFKLKEGDTLSIKFSGVIKEICQKKGCWLTVDLTHGKKAFVRFKDYGFFVPKDAHNRTAILNGKAYVEIMSVDDLRHYAKDEGKPKEVIDTITQPQITYAFMADGVLISK